MCIFFYSGQESTTNSHDLDLPTLQRLRLGAWAADFPGCGSQQGQTLQGGTSWPPALLLDDAHPKCLREMHRATARSQVLKACIYSPNVTSRCLSLPRSPNRRGFLQQAEGRHENASPRASDRGDVRRLCLPCVPLPSWAALQMMVQGTSESTLCQPKEKQPNPALVSSCAPHLLAPGSPIA